MAGMGTEDDEIWRPVSATRLKNRKSEKYARSKNGGGQGLKNQELKGGGILTCLFGTYTCLFSVYTHAPKSGLVLA
jgi:hypothetical protein